MDIPGGKLNTEICACYILQLEYNRKVILGMCDGEYKDINMTSINTMSTQTLKILRNFQVYKYVGITISLSGNPKEFIIALQKICNKFAHNI